MKSFSALLTALLIVFLAPFSFCEDVTPVILTEKEATATDEGVRSRVQGSVDSRRDARAMTLSIPAPRGLITDRHGEPLAQNKVGYYFALEFPLAEKLEDAKVLEFARKRVDHVFGLQALEINLSDKRILDHYHNRRWMPLQFAHLVGPSRAEEYRDKLMRGLILHPVYYRYYPEGDTLAHIIGYVRSKGKLPTGPINYGDPLFEETVGKAGLESMYDDELTGSAGLRKIIYDSDGSRLLDELDRQPEVGNTVVTTLDLKWQKHAESVLEKSCERGAFVLVDIPTGDVLVMASRPSYDINVWIPSISQVDYDALLNDESKPMFGRAFQAGYPPASTFKPVVALAALTNGKVDKNTKIDCPTFIKIGKFTFRNHSKYPGGQIAVDKALALSNNVWFYKVGIKTRAENFLSVARRLGFGSTTGLPLFGETAGLIPDDKYMIDTLGRPTTDGDTANWSIGQGAVSASPLQVAQAMAGIANGSVLPNLRMIRQVQDAKGGVLTAPGPGARNSLTLDPEAVEVVHKGMHDVVHAPYGTGQRGSVKFCEMAGKTGTAQWVKDRELAWFAGFLPYDNPRFAFVALYEGMPGEAVSGGRKAAPMIPRFFNPLADEMKDIIEPPSKAMIIVEEEDLPEGVEEAPEGVLDALPLEPVMLEEAGGAETALRAIPIDEETLADLENAPVAVLVEEEMIEESEGEEVVAAEALEEEDYVPSETLRAIPVDEEELIRREEALRKQEEELRRQSEEREEASEQEGAQ